jgi:mono/diheme cytochrome c family protein
MNKFMFALAAAALAAAPAFAADTAAGKAIYSRSCQSCHGLDGAPNPGIEKAENVTIRDLKSQEVQSISDADMKNIITQGKGKMHAVSGLSGKQLDDVVAYIKSWK